MPEKLTCSGLNFPSVVGGVGSVVTTVFTDSEPDTLQSCQFWSGCLTRESREGNEAEARERRKGVSSDGVRGGRATNSGAVDSF